MSIIPSQRRRKCKVESSVAATSSSLGVLRATELCVKLPGPAETPDATLFSSQPIQLKEKLFT